MPQDPGSDRPPKHVPQTMGPMPPDLGSKGQEQQDGLQRALEAEMVIFLREQNEKLQEELDLLKKKQDSLDGASSRWKSPRRRVKEKLIYKSYIVAEKKVIVLGGDLAGSAV